jgi:glycerol-3-phosphate O-acyltransferase/dihydroxyacetone phosphate acyltransferase
LKTGAARIALGANSMKGNEHPLQIVPLGIYYTAKGIFRSSALLYFGQPIFVDPIALEPSGEPPPEAVHALTDRIERALNDVTLQADEHEALALVTRAEDVFSSEGAASDERLVEKFELRRRFMAGYSTLRDKEPQRLAAISARIDRFEAEVRDAGVDPKTLQPGSVSSSRGAAAILDALGLLIMLPVAVIGTIVNYPVYRLVGVITTRLSREDDDIIATIKMISGALLFPVTWIVLSVAIGIRFGLPSGIAALLLAPLAGYIALLFFERLDGVIAGARAVVLARFRRWGYLRLVAERGEIREEILRLGAEIEG